MQNFQVRIKLRCFAAWMPVPLFDGLRNSTSAESGAGTMRDVVFRFAAIFAWGQSHFPLEPRQMCNFKNG